jgi:hypothetical protein
MLSHVSRAGTIRNRTLAQLPVTPIVVESFAKGSTDLEVRKMAWYCMEKARDNPAGMVFLEDDLDVVPELFLKHVDMAVSLGHVTAFCLLRLNCYPGWVQALAKRGAKLPEQIVEMKDFAKRHGFHGSMAVYLPASLVSYALDHPEEFHNNGQYLRKPVVEADFKTGRVTGFDFWLKSHAKRMFVAIPNSVDHADPPSVHGGTRLRAMKSPTFRGRL